MQLELQSRKLGEIPVGAILMLPLFFLPLGAFMVGANAINLGTCGFKMLLGLPCLTCGSTRATIFLFDGNLGEAIYYQPMMLLIYAILLVWGAVSLWGFIARKRVLMKLSDREDLVLKLLIVGIPLANWAYLVSAGI